MKILVLQDYLRSGGTERQSVLLANAFAAAGHPTTLLTFRPGGTLNGTVDATVTRATLQPFDTRCSWFAPNLVRSARQHRPEVILCMGRMANCQAGRLQSRLPETYVIATLRTGKKLPWLYRRSLRQVRHVIANSQASARWLHHRLGLPGQKISAIPNAIVFPAPAAGSNDGRAASAERTMLRTQHQAGPATTVLLCVAMFRPEKNHRELLQIAARLPRNGDWQLWLAGEGETRAGCAALVQQLGLADRVKFLGYQANPTPLYHAADVAVLSSQSESLPNFLIEAQAHGLPVVAYDVGGVRECFLPEKTGWAVPPGDVTAFAAALAPLLADPARRAALAAGARAFAHDGFAPASQIRRHLELFTRLQQLA